MWYSQATFYQIYPLGCLGAPFENDYKLAHRLSKLNPWIDHIKEMGIDALLLNPIFESHTHGYDTIDPKLIDTRLGTNDDFVEVVKYAHSKGIRVIIDAVFNHVGRGFFAFQDVLKYRQDSYYKDWFYIDFNGNNRFDDHLWYKDWEGNDILIKLNLENPEVVDYFKSVLDLWIDIFDVDGLRLDVAYCLDKNFLKTVHAYAKAKKSDFFLLGECLHGDYKQWVNEEMLDSCTNYECYKGLYSSFNSHNFFEICHSLQRQFGKEPWCLYNDRTLLAFVDNHDVTRIASQLKDHHHLQLIYALMLSMPGQASIYYGSEWAIDGIKNANDTSLRPAIDVIKSTPLTSFIKEWIKLKKLISQDAGLDFYQVALSNEACIIGRGSYWIGMNMSDRNQTVALMQSSRVENVLTGEECLLENSFTFAPFQICVFKKVLSN